MIFFRLRFWLLSLLTGVILPCTAQNNPYKIHDSLYPNLYAGGPAKQVP